MDKQIYIRHQDESSLIKYVLESYPSNVPQVWNSHKHIKDFFAELDTWLAPNIVFSKEQYEFMRYTFLDPGDSLYNIKQRYGVE